MMTQVDPLVLAAAADCASQKDCICDWSTLPKACLFKYCCGTLISGLGQTSPEYTNSLPSPADVISHSPAAVAWRRPFRCGGQHLAVPQNANPDPWPRPHLPYRCSVSRPSSRHSISRHGVCPPRTGACLAMLATLPERCSLCCCTSPGSRRVQCEPRTVAVSFSHDHT
jgi:hypothetical protein